MESIGQRVIRSFLPEQHRDFFAQLPFIVVGSVDDSGWPWASILSGTPGFVDSPSPTTLTIRATALPGDPLATNIKPDAALGLLGIEIPTRRRNRVNVHVTDVADGVLGLAVDQSFGNCPQYIQRRSIDFVHSAGESIELIKATKLTSLDSTAVAMINAADTFFVSSYIHSDERPEIEGVDVSHRGGKPGFVNIDGNTLTVPDYAGNNFFNTLGNFLVNPKAGLVFVDFETGDILQLTGTVEILWEEEAEVKAFKGAERGWRFKLDHAIRLSAALPFRSVLKDFSPNSLITGDWAQSAATIAAEAKRDAWREYRLARIEDESSVIRSFYLEPTDGDGLPNHEPGQFATIRVTPDAEQAPWIRTYTVSSAPGEQYYRISVKREAEGVVSQYLHDRLKVGDVIDVRAPKGDFFIDAAENRPAVLLAGGVGITPMMSMAQHIANEGLRTRHLRPLTVFHASQTTEQRAFADDFKSLEQLSGGKIRYRSFISQPAETEEIGIDFEGSGFITADDLKNALAMDDYDFYLCGPAPFMQALYDALRSLGVRDARINAEAFGPAALIRQPDEGSNTPPVVEEADNAVIRFSASGIEQQWNSGGDTLLEAAEKQGLTPVYSCRSGNCGSCATKITAGSVTYRTIPTASHAGDEILICCAVPAKGATEVEIDL